MAQAAEPKAHAAVAKALAEGTLTREPCEVCGAASVHAHHDDYRKPLSVRWLCRRHHALEHRHPAIRSEKPVTVRVHLTPDEWHAFRVDAISRGVSASVLATEILRGYIDKHEGKGER